MILRDAFELSLGVGGGKVYFEMAATSNRCINNFTFVSSQHEESVSASLLRLLSPSLGLLCVEQRWTGKETE